MEDGYIILVKARRFPLRNWKSSYLCWKLIIVVNPHFPDGTPYSDYKNYVFSKSVSGSDEYASFIDEDVKTFIKNIKQKPGKDIWLIGGGNLAREFFKENLIDEFQLAIAPIILGKGISLYNGEDITRKYTLTKVEKLGQLAMLHYIKNNFHHLIKVSLK